MSTGCSELPKEMCTSISIRQVVQKFRGTFSSGTASARMREIKSFMKVSSVTWPRKTGQT